MLTLLKTDYFQLWFLYKNDLRISTADLNSIVDHIKISMVPL